MPNYEYAVIRSGDDPGDLHRGPWPKDAAEQWVQEWDDMQENRPNAVGMFRVVRREVGAWHEV